VRVPTSVQINLKTLIFLVYSLGMTEVYLAIYDLSMGTAQQLSAMFLGPENAISCVPHTGIVAYNNEYFFSSSGINHQNPSSFRNSNGGLQPLEVKLIGKTSKTQSEFETWLYFGDDIPSRFHGSRYKLLEHNCNTFSDYALRHGFGFSVGVPQWILDVPRKVMSSPLGMMLASSMENMQPFGNTAPSQPVGSNSSFNPPVPTSWQRNTVNNTTEPSEEKMQTLSNTIKNTPMLDSHNNLLLSKDSSSFIACVKKLQQLSLSDEQKRALDILHTKFNNNKLSPSVTTDTINQALGPFFSSDKKETSSSNILYSLMVLRVLLLQTHPMDNKPFDLSPFIREIIQLLCSSSTMKDSTKSMAWCTLSNAFYNACHYKAILTSSALEDLTNVALNDTINNPKSCIKGIISLKQSSSTFLYNLVHVISFKDTAPQDSNGATNHESTLPDWCVNIVCNIAQELENETDMITQQRRIIILGKIMQKSSLGKELVRDIGLLHDISLENVNFEKNKLLVQEVVTSCVD